MKKSLLLLLSFIYSSTLFAVNPTIYSALSDDIYDNAEKIKKLKKLKNYSTYKDKIDNYLLYVKKTKKFGFEVESGTRSNIALDYLEELRELSKVNDYFQRTIEADFKKAIQTQDNDLFIGIVNTGLLDTRRNKNKIMDYYKAHKSLIASDGVIKKYLNEEKAKKKRVKKNKKSKKNETEERIQRIRENDKLKQEALKNKLENKLREKKRAIREAQEKELFN